MTTKIIRVSTSAKARFFLRVLAVDLELRLFEDEILVFDAHKDQKPPLEQPLALNTAYLLRYNNNDGGSGALHFQVLEELAEPVSKFEVNRRAIHSPEVMEFQFSLRAEP